MVIYVLANAATALTNPLGFLKARWTARRGIPENTSSFGVRVFGVFLVAVGFAWGWVTLKLTWRIVTGR